MTIRFQERLAERTRIAQELHDTLLQGFLSASMQMHVAADSVPEDSPVKGLLAGPLSDVDIGSGLGPSRSLPRRLVKSGYVTWDRWFSVPNARILSNGNNVPLLPERS